MRYKLFPRHMAEMTSPDDFVIPEIPDGASTREIGIIMIQTIGGLARQFNRANEARDIRDRKRSYTLSGVAIGLLIDVALSLLAFKLIAGLNQANSRIAAQQATITSQQRQLVAQAAKLHSNQLDNCANSNKTRATARTVLTGILNATITPATPQAARDFIAAQDQRIITSYKNVDCAAAYPLPGKLREGAT